MYNIGLDLTKKKYESLRTVYSKRSIQAVPLKVYTKSIQISDTSNFNALFSDNQRNKPTRGCVFSIHEISPIFFPLRRSFNVGTISSIFVYTKIERFCKRPLPSETMRTCQAPPPPFLTPVREVIDRL